MAMMKMERKLQQVKNTIHVVIPQGICAVLGLKKNDRMKFTVKDGKAIIIEKIS